MISFYIFAWIASIAYGLEVVIVKLVNKHLSPNLWVFNFIWNFLILLLIVPFAIANHATLPTEWLNVIMAGLLYAIAGITYVTSLSKLDVSVFTPLFSFRTVFAVILAAIFLNERLNPEQLYLIAIIFIGGLFVSTDESFSIRTFFNKKIFYALLMMAIIALEAIFANKSINELGFWTASLWIALIAQVILIFTWPKFGKDLKKIGLKEFGATLLGALTGVVGVLASNKAFAENIGVSAAIISLPISMIIAFLFSVFAPQLLEKHTIKVYVVRFSAAAVMILAALKLN
ncbi:MAG: S-adenosylmethionine uptake transporter [Candidatus Doudnabacteria bacterium Gr01-1014_77]|uniref:S-adenosylmethionine uptake transporter n=1 Tax=Candidatus Doudnabacteria bacterium Gr01-1014_77 TaxID=2017133 RepID=A0A554JBP1_9BACT|nr:MAG: S-adenosylmethionine uptake transporter [Candidatus Doudnabacteria bacterium Gr01-1014_77]